MKHYSFKFFFIKFIIYTIFNAVSFGIFLLADITFTKLMPDEYIQRAVFCTLGYAVFIGMAASTIAKMKKSDMPFVPFVLRECISYMAFLLIPTTVALICGIGKMAENPIMLFFAPQLAFHHITGIPVVGFVIHSLIFALAASFAHTRNIKIRKKEEMQISQGRKEDEEYANKTSEL